MHSLAFPPAAFRRFRRAKAALFPRLRSAIASNRCRSSREARPTFQRARAAFPGGLSSDARRAAGIANRAQRPPKNITKTSRSLDSAHPSHYNPINLLNWLAIQRKGRRMMKDVLLKMLRRNFRCGRMPFSRAENMAGGVGVPLLCCTVPADGATGHMQSGSDVRPGFFRTPPIDDERGMNHEQISF